MTRPVVLPARGPARFPDPTGADAHGLVAVGGDLTPERLIDAYDHGIFPWYDAGVPPLWWSPDPRAVLELPSLHVSRSLQRCMRRGSFELAFDRDFEAVIRACASERRRGTWILPEMIEAYVELHRLGHAHSFELWMDGELAGGLYGVHRGALFAAESMFHRRTNASKIALVATVRSLGARGVRLFDVQFETPHLVSMGARNISRRDYLARVEKAVATPVELSGMPLLLFGNS